MTAAPLTRRSVAGNIATLFSSSAISRGLTSLVFLLLARHLGADLFGVFSANLALASISSVLFNLGLDTWLMQTGARQPEHLRQAIGSVFAVKLRASLLWGLVLLILAQFLDPSTFPLPVLFWTAVTVLLDGLFAAVLASFKTTLRNKYVLVLESSSVFAWMIATLLLIASGSLELTAYLQVRAAVLGISLLAGLAVLSKKIGLQYSPPAAGAALRQTLPFAGSEFLAQTSMRVDLLIISFALGKTAAGVYSPALSLANALFFVPGAVHMVMIPVLSRLYHTNLPQARRTTLRALGLHTAIGITLGAGLLAITPWIVLFLGESYRASLPLLKIFSLLLVLKAITFAFAAVLVATRQQTRRVVVQALAAVLNILLNLMVVFSFGLTGVAWVYVITEAITMLGYGWLAWRTRPAQNSQELRAETAHTP